MNNHLTENRLAVSPWRTHAKRLSEHPFGRLPRPKTPAAPIDSWLGTKRARRQSLAWRILIVLVLGGAWSAVASAQEDPRQFQHGIDLVPLSSGHYWLIWSSSGNPPTGADPHGNWTHDIYYSDIDPANPQITPQTIISNPEAQEPASSAIASNGRIMITMEDGWNADNTIAQRFGVYNSDFSPVDPYQADDNDNLVLDGGHSGHVAAVGNRFVVFYSEGWVDGGGVDDLGSGDDVMLKVYSSNGTPKRAKNVAVGGATRDWWPLVAGSNDNAMLLWQRFVNNETYADLMISVYDPVNGTMVQGQTKIADGVQYYTYDVQYLASIDRFLTVGTYDAGGGFAYLLDNTGAVVGQNLSLPPSVREAQPAIQLGDGLARVVYPKSPGGVMALSVTDDSITLEESIDGYQWQTMGTDGIFTASDEVYFVSLSTGGLVEKTFMLVSLSHTFRGTLRRDTFLRS